MGNISLGITLVAGRNRVPMPAAGMTAVWTCRYLMGRFTVTGLTRRHALRILAEFGLGDLLRSLDLR